MIRMTRSNPIRSRPSPAIAVRAASLAFLVALFACSGGSAGGPTAPSSPSPSQVEAASGQLVNSERQAAGLPTLVIDPDLAAIARAHSEAMRDLGFFGHLNPSGQSFADRLRAGGQAFTAAGENLARVTNAPDPATFAHQQLMASGEHRASILDPGFNRIGVGVARAGNEYWITQLFVQR